MTERSRTHGWSDPHALFAAASGLSGADYYAAWARGELEPPMAATLGFHLADHGEGRVSIACTPDEYHYSPYGMAHGGLAATLLDTATGCAVHTRLAQGEGYATVDLHVTYLRPITVDTGPLTVSGEVVSMGRRVAVATGIVADGDGRELARATGTCLLLRRD